MKLGCNLVTMSNHYLAWFYKRILRLPLIAILISTVLLAGCQSRFIYYPRPYPSGLEQRLPERVKMLSFVTEEGKQVGFYITPRNGEMPRQIWLGHSGNGALALDWLRMVVNYPEQDVGFLLVDYPGYGYCEGSSTPGRILANSEGAVAALRIYLSMTKDEIDMRMCAFGHSLGAASTLQYSARHPVQKVVLVAPFTSMADMVDHALFWPMHWFLWHRFDNQKSLKALAERSPSPPVTIIHGTHDEVIPLAMGHKLAQENPSFVRLIEIPNGNHNDIPTQIIINCMMDDSQRN